LILTIFSFQETGNTPKSGALLHYFAPFDTWTGTVSFPIKVTLAHEQPPGEIRFVKSTPDFTRTMELYLRIDGLVPNSEGC
jgi:hypothetical protein